MESFARRIQILRIISRRRFETVSNLANELNVTDRTIKNDILFLMAPELGFGIYTVQGRYGGVYAVEGWTFG